MKIYISFAPQGYLYVLTSKANKVGRIKCGLFHFNKIDKDINHRMDIQSKRFKSKYFIVASSFL
jgi:hypothetical protein